MTHDTDRAVAITALRRAIPYLRLFQGKVFVIKGGGDAFTTPQNTRALLEQVGVLHQVGIRCVVVHGGGAQATKLSEKLGIETRFVEGRRVTDGPTLEVATMVLNGSMNTQLVAACRALGVPAIGLSGVDAGLVRARKRPPRRTESGETVDYGFVGDIVSVDASLLQRVLDQGYVPIVSPLSADDQGTILNINADVVAARIATEMKAEKLVFVTAVPGILRDAADVASLISYTDIRGLNQLQESGAVKEGMLPKTTAIKDALYGGVSRVHVVSHKVPDSLLMEVFTNEGSGTLVVHDTKELLPEEIQPPSRVETMLRMTGAGR